MIPHRGDSHIWAPANKGCCLILDNSTLQRGCWTLRARLTVSTDHTLSRAGADASHLVGSNRTSAMDLSRLNGEPRRVGGIGLRMPMALTDEAIATRFMPSSAATRSALKLRATLLLWISCRVSSAAEAISSRTRAFPRVDSDGDTPYVISITGTRSAVRPPVLPSDLHPDADSMRNPPWSTSQPTPPSHCTPRPLLLPQTRRNPVRPPGCTGN